MFDQNITYGPGTGTFASHTFEILIMLLGAFVLGTWLGWALWARYRQEAERLRLDNASLNATLGTLNADLEAARARATAAETERNNLSAHLDLVIQENTNHQSRLDTLESDLRAAHERNRQLETELGLSAPPDTPMPIEDVPFEVEEPAPAEPATDTFPSEVPETVAPAAALETPNVEEVAYTDVPAPTATDQPVVPNAPVVIVQPMVLVAPTADQLNAVLASANETETHHEPIFQAAVPPGQRDDLKIVEGIGPKIEELLFKNGIDTYAELAATTVERLREILADSGPRFSMHDPGTWSAQALLAANGEWENLKSYQDFLNAGKRPDK